VQGFPATSAVIACISREPGAGVVNKVNLVFAGHDHVNERTVPIGDVTYIVSGGGGRRLYPASVDRLTACSRSAHHAVLGRVHGGRLSLEAVEPDGTVFERFDSIVSEG